MLLTLKGNTASVTGLGTAADGKHAVSASIDGTLKLWDLRIGCALRTLKGHTALVSSVVVTVKGDRMASGQAIPG